MATVLGTRIPLPGVERKHGPEVTAKRLRCGTADAVCMEVPARVLERQREWRRLVQTNREESGKALQPSNGKEPKGFGSDAESNGNRNAFLVALQEALKISDYGLLSRLLEQTAGAALIGGVKAPNDWYYPA